MQRGKQVLTSFMIAAKVSGFKDLISFLLQNRAAARWSAVQSESGRIEIEIIPSKDLRNTICVANCVQYTSRYLSLLGVASAIPSSCAVASCRRPSKVCAHFLTSSFGSCLVSFSDDTQTRTTMSEPRSISRNCTINQSVLSPDKPSALVNSQVSSFNKRTTSLSPGSLCIKPNGS